MKINYLRNPLEDSHISMIEYVNDMMKYQKNYSSNFEITDYVPKFNPILNLLAFKWKMRIARFISYPMQVKKLPLYDVTHIGDQGYSHLVNHFKSKVKILTVNDLIPLVYEKKIKKNAYNPSGKGTDKHKVYFFRYVAKHFKYFDRVIAISENTKNDILKLTDCKESNITVVHTNIPPPEFNTTPINKNDIWQKYKIPTKPKKILIYGTGFYKNHITSLKVLKNLISKNIDTVIVWIGHREETKKINNQNLVNKIIQMPIIEKKELPLIYKSCDVVLYPSLYEGMGNLTLESMRCGIPVICSNSSAFPEIAGNAGIMCEPLNDQEITKNIIKLFTDKEFYKKKTEEGLSRSKLFNYDQMHQKIINIYKDELSKKLA